jgi:hypothetical protein
MVYIFLDFDQTITMTHSGGEPKPGRFAHYFGGMGVVVRLRDVFQSLRSKGHIIYICTRGVAPLVRETVEYAMAASGYDGAVFGKGHLIECVLGANTSREISVPYEDKTEREVILNMLRNHPFKFDDDSSALWSHRKVEFIGATCALENVLPGDVLFLDDTESNIAVAQLHGYVGSSVVTGVMDTLSILGTLGACK